MSSPFNEKSINCLPHVPTNEALNDIPTIVEIQNVIHQLSNDKAPGCDENAC